MDISVIIVNYNTCSVTLECLKSIFEHTKNIEFEVIVIDNASTDSSCLMINKVFPLVKVIELSKNVGFGNANNLGVKMAKGNYLFFLNSDTILLNNAIKLFFEYANSKNNNAIYGTLLVDLYGNRIHSFGKFPTIKNSIEAGLKVYTERIPYFRNIFATDYESKILKDAKNEYYVDYITGADLFCSHNIFNELGGFDSNFFMYYEESDLQYSMHKRGIKRIIITTPKIVHLENKSVNTENSKKSANKILLSTQSMFIYLKKHNTFLGYIFFRFIFLLVRFIPALLNEFSFREKIKYFYLLLKKQ